MMAIVFADKCSSDGRGLQIEMIGIVKDVKTEEEAFAKAKEHWGKALSGDWSERVGINIIADDADFINIPLFLGSYQETFHNGVREL